MNHHINIYAFANSAIFVLKEYLKEFNEKLKNDARDYPLFVPTIFSHFIRFETFIITSNI